MDLSKDPDVHRLADDSLTYNAKYNDLLAQHWITLEQSKPDMINTYLFDKNSQDFTCPVKFGKNHESKKSDPSVFDSIKSHF